MSWNNWQFRRTAIFGLLACCVFWITWPMLKSHAPEVQIEVVKGAFTLAGILASGYLIARRIDKG